MFISFSFLPNWNLEQRDVMLICVVSARKNGSTSIAWDFPNHQLDGKCGSVPSAARSFRCMLMGIRW
jgi:hypothetical protein